MMPRSTRRPRRAALSHTSTRAFEPKTHSSAVTRFQPQSPDRHQRKTDQEGQQPQRRASDEHCAKRADDRYIEVDVAAVFTLAQADRVASSARFAARSGSTCQGSQDFREWLRGAAAGARGVHGVSSHSLHFSSQSTAARHIAWPPTQPARAPRGIVTGATAPPEGTLTSAPATVPS